MLTPLKCEFEILREGSLTVHLIEDSGSVTFLSTWMLFHLGLKQQHDRQMNEITLIFDHMKLSLSVSLLLEVIFQSTIHCSWTPVIKNVLQYTAILNLHFHFCFYRWVYHIFVCHEMKDGNCHLSFNGQDQNIWKF